MIDRVLVRLIRELLDVDVPVVYPVGHVLVALAGTLVLALIVMALPLRRAVHLRPGEALRYAYTLGSELRARRSPRRQPS